uniref:Uncharacterized protein n=1 Tax=Anopheles minimus TaxID=112268 RepID=A0A182WKE7_9DIPT
MAYPNCVLGERLYIIYISHAVAAGCACIAVRSRCYGVCSASQIGAMTTIVQVYSSAFRCPDLQRTNLFL